YQYGGTFIGAVICQDGIVMASDSRITFVDGTGLAFGYVDGFPKIYVDRGAAVAVTGLTSVEGETFSSFVNRNRFLLDRPVNEILFGFGLWLPFTNSNSIGMISAGFLDGKPMLCSKAPITPQSCSNSGFISNKNSILLRDRLTGLGRAATTAEAADALKAAIEEYSRTDPAVGGPISILKLTNEQRPEWLANPSVNSSLKQICDLVREHRTGSRRIMPLGTPEALDQHLSAACPK
ncbi:MAG TPA: hypothetical protein VER98_01185, partial [Terriglobia bacterium]|nr:hypothetical protein [Terriglobia bacterium]